MSSESWERGQGEVQLMHVFVSLQGPPGPPGPKGQPVSQWGRGWGGLFDDYVCIL